MKKTVTILILFLIIISAINKTKKVVIPKEAIRFRVIANSNTNIDQNNKKKIAKELSYDLVNILSETNSIEEARNTIQSNISNFETTVNQIVEKENYDTTVSIEYGNHYFPEKKYKGVTYESGEYESLVVKLGQGKGENFWCVLFPPLCLLEAEENETDEVRYKSFIKEIIDKYF